MFRPKHFIRALPLISVVLLLSAVPQASAQERLCDTSFEDCRQALWTLIDNETVGIDVSFWFIQDTSLSNKIIARFQAGVPVRILCDPRASDTYAGNQDILNQFRAAGIPMRYKVADCILHRKFMLFVGQGQIEFSGANYGPFFFVPSQPYVDYIDEAIYFTTATSILNSFKTIMDDMWTDTMNYGNYANITGPLTRRYPTFPIDPELNFPPSVDGSESYLNRSLVAFNHETQKIDVIMYRITNLTFTNMTIDAVNRGIPVRLITEQDEYRNATRPWDSYNVDLLYNAGVQLRIRKHQGLNHEKVAMLYGQGLTIFGSSNWTGPSANCQAENNYFTTKAWFLDWFANQFERKWNSTTETQPFTPLPPTGPSYQSPSNNATGRPTNASLSWEGGPYAHKFDIYLGTNPNPPLFASDQFIGSVDNGSVPETYTPPSLQAGTKYYWRIVSKTMANMTTSGPIWSFTTAGTPPPGPAPTISNINPNSGTTIGGTSVTITGTNFVSGARVTIGGAAATGVAVTSGTAITATTPAHAGGAVSVVVTNPDNQSATLTGGFTYQTSPPGPPPTISSITPNSGTTAGGTAVTISGSNFVFGAIVKLGGTAATGVVVSNATTITATTPAHAAGATDVVVTNPDNQSATLTGGFTYQTPPPPPPGTLLADDFTSPAIDTSKWIANNLFSGFVDTGVPISQSSQQLNIGPLPQGAAASGSHYRGVYSANAYNFTNAYAQVEIVQPPASNSAADAMLTIGRDSNNYYRIYVEAGNLILQKRIAGTKTTLGTVPFNAVNHRFVRIRHDVGLGSLVFETAPGSGVPGTWTQLFSEIWNTASVPLASVLFELKAGTWTTEANAPGTVIFDNFKAAVPGSGPAPAPTVGSITPNTGPTTGSTAVTITGTNFVSGATVTLGGTAATNVVVTNSTTITATTSAHTAGTFDVMVANSDGQNATLTGGFTYDPPPAPTIANLSPNTGPTTGGTSVTLTGTGFLNGTTVTFGGVAAAGVVVPNNTTITATTPAHAAGAVDVVVTNTDSQSATLAGGFNYQTPPPPPAPTISSITPNSGPTTGGTSVTISGTNFVGGASVTIGGAAATGVLVSNSTTIIATTPAHTTGAVNVVVTNPDNQSTTLPGGFTYQTPPPPPAPTVTGITPSAGNTGGGTAVTIAGTGFQAGATVKLGGTAATNVVFSNSTTITAKTPPHGAGPVDVVVTNTDNQNGTLTDGFTYAERLETLLLVDDFNGNSVDQTKWKINNLFSGFTDAALPVLETNQHLEIGALFQQTGGSHYNGLVSQQRYDFTNAYAYVAVVQAPGVNTTADAMFTLGQDANNYYRIYEEAGVLYVQKRLAGGAKVTMWSATYDSTAHRYWRIRHDGPTGNVVFETAPDNGAGPWIIRYGEAWSTSAMPLGSILFEVKAGTWQAEAATAGKVIFDDFKASKP